MYDEDLDQKSTETWREVCREIISNEWPNRERDEAWVEALPEFTIEPKCEMCGATDPKDVHVGKRQQQDEVKAPACCTCKGSGKRRERRFGAFWDSWETVKCYMCSGTGKDRWSAVRSHPACPAYMVRVCKCGYSWHEQTLGK